MAARPRQVSNEEILAVASQCFLKMGTSISTQVIADRLNISQPALFKRFGTKEELMIRALLPPEKLPIIEWLDTGPDNGPLKPQFDELLHRVWKMVSFVLPRISVLTSSGIDPNFLVSQYQTFPLIRVIQSLAGWLGRASEMGKIELPGDPIRVAQACLGPLQGRALLRFIFSDTLYRAFNQSENEIEQEDEAYIALVASMLWRAFGKEILTDSDR